MANTIMTATEAAGLLFRERAALVDKKFDEDVQRRVIARRARELGYSSKDMVKMVFGS